MLCSFSCVTGHSCDDITKHLSDQPRSAASSASDNNLIAPDDSEVTQSNSPGFVRSSGPDCDSIQRVPDTPIRASKQDGNDNITRQIFVQTPQRSSGNNNGSLESTREGTPSEASQSPPGNSVRSSGDDVDTRCAEDTPLRASKQDRSGNVTHKLNGQTSHRSSGNNSGGLDFTGKGTPSVAEMRSLI